MTTQLEAIFQGGVLRPLQSLWLSENQKVSLTIATLPATTDEAAYLDTDLHRYCESRADDGITLEQVRKELASIPGSIAGDIIEDREERF
ncbi:MAG TPA: antitoxin family protein [Blastocatellia bacterium]|nr:antitoxin family protein [Blastocatellia bacterium]HMV83206.1 antitoxin family protein [Blastocatellia bacterium]HMX26438.1 antitoxin family protein [Blastocatellia bacterium]HMY75758.1 antitoxin family protein [Blastocatellia bacterium]HMZ22001.1 antitoxin family protein [Blastocatellia bacterium]